MVIPFLDPIRWQVSVPPRPSEKQQKKMKFVLKKSRE